MNILECLQKVKLFADLTDEQRERIVAACRRRTYRGKVQLFYEGEPGGQLYIVLRGGVKIYSADGVNGPETTLALLSAGDFFGEMALLIGGARTASAVTLVEETELLLLDQDSFHALLRESFELTSELMRNLALRLKHTNENLVAMSSNSSLSRVAKLLLARADTGSGLLSPPLSQEEIANLIGVRRETVARNLARLESTSCVRRNRGHLVVTDRGRLEQMARNA